MADKRSPKDWSPTEQFGAAVIFQTLEQIAPSIAFGIGWSRDDSFVWDGDGPDPAEEGYQAYDVDVRAQAIEQGQLVDGSKSLGGVYAKHDDRDPDIHGYLPQMLEEAAEDLEGQVSGEVKKQAQTARKYLKEVLRARHKMTPRR